MKLLDAVNLILPKLGERSVTSLEVKHPTLAVLLPILTQTRLNTLQPGWWFNSFDYTAHPDSGGEIVLGSDCLSFVPRTAGEAVVRGDRLFNPAALTFKFTGPVRGRLIQDVAFDGLPDSCATYVLYTALVEAFTTDLGVTQELQVWQTRAFEAKSNLLAEHLRQRKHSTRKTRAWYNFTSALQG